MSNRHDTNLEILDKLKEYVEKYPDMRFCQLLHMLGFYNGDKFYEESITTLVNITWKNVIKNNNENNGFTK